MAKKNIITKIEGNKAWGYMAMGVSFLALVGIAIVAKEEYSARKASDNLAIAEAELEAVVSGAEASAEVVEGAVEVGVGKLEIGVDELEAKVSAEKSDVFSGFVSSYRPLRASRTFRGQ